MTVSWPQALAWRLRRQLLDPAGDVSAADVVRTLGAVAAQPDGAAELAVGARRRRSRPGDVARALADGELIRTFAFRGATHLLTPEEGGDYLALRAASRMWELPSWQSYYGLTPADWPDLREAVRDALADGPLTYSELAEAVTAHAAFRHLAPRFADGAWTLLKPLAWQGDLTLGPSPDGGTTFQRLAGNPRWPGLPDLDEAGTRAVVAYFRTYGPATPSHVQYWLGEGLGAGRKRIRSWIAGLGDRLAPVDVDGEPAHVLREDLDDLQATPPTTTVRLLPRYDQWVLGPGTADQHVVPAAGRAAISRGANPLVVGGVVAGTWSSTGDDLTVDWFPGAPVAEPGALEHELQALSTTLGRDLRRTR
ncbi:winged helix DNA-binding domain-containing protein [Cellulomonas sp. ICMP 17802]|uniref:winged helix DNA-binding domain-containing protein n=1 Tax=Cellulomonas sp. ICMP 17802 TaxID=3239199 RepID=UPI00351BEC0D